MITSAQLSMRAVPHAVLIHRRLVTPEIVHTVGVVFHYGHACLTRHSSSKVSKPG